MILRVRRIFFEITTFPNSEIPSWGLFRRSAGGGIDHGGLLHQHHSLFDEVCTTKKDTSMTFWAERNFFYHTYDTSMTIIVTKHGIIIDVVGSYFYDKKS